MEKEYSNLSDSEKKKEDWMNSKWRPMMGWMYMAVCVCDFMLFPVLWSLLQALDHGKVTEQWQPLTLQGAGLFHIAMGAVLGLSAWGRTQEKLNGANAGGLPPPQPTPAPITSMTPSFQQSHSFDAPPVNTGFGGKKMPPDSPQPLI